MSAATVHEQQHANKVEEDARRGDDDEEDAALSMVL